MQAQTEAAADTSPQIVDDAEVEKRRRAMLDKIYKAREELEFKVLVVNHRRDKHRVIMKSRDYDFDTETEQTVATWQAVVDAVEKYAHKLIDAKDVRAFWHSHREACRREHSFDELHQDERDAVLLANGERDLREVLDMFTQHRAHSTQVVAECWTFIQYVRNAQESKVSVTREQKALFAQAEKLAARVREVKKEMKSQESDEEDKARSKSEMRSELQDDSIRVRLAEEVKQIFNITEEQMKTKDTKTLSMFDADESSVAVIDKPQSATLEEHLEKHVPLEAIVEEVEAMQADGLLEVTEETHFVEGSNEDVLKLEEQYAREASELTSEATDVKTDAHASENRSYERLDAQDNTQTDIQEQHGALVAVEPAQTQPSVFIGQVVKHPLEHVEVVLDESEKAMLSAVEIDELEAKEEDEQQGLFGDIAIERVIRKVIYEDDAMIEAAFKFHRERGFPYRDLSAAVCMSQINTLSKIEGDALINTSEAYQVADTYHRHRMHANATGKKSPFQAFSEDKLLRRAIALELKMRGKPEVYAGGMLTLVLGTQACSNFRPGFACHLYRKYAPENATVLDTSTGYGGRLVGAVASQRVAHYIGIDPNKPTHEANIRMATELSFAHMIELYNLPAEDVDVSLLRERCDFAFTSPPYFSKEQYAHDNTQSWIRYKTGEQWRDKFLKKMLALQFEALKHDTFNIVNIADVNIKSKRYPLAQWTVECGESVGFKYVTTDKFPMMKRFGANQSDEVAIEPVIIFKKA